MGEKKTRKEEKEIASEVFYLIISIYSETRNEDFVASYIATHRALNVKGGGEKFQRAL